MPPKPASEIKKKIHPPVPITRTPDFEKIKATAKLGLSPEEQVKHDELIKRVEFYDRECRRLDILREEHEKQIKDKDECLEIYRKVTDAFELVLESQKRCFSKDDFVDFVADHDKNRTMANIKFLEKSRKMLDLIDDFQVEDQKRLEDYKAHKAEMTKIQCHQFIAVQDLHKVNLLATLQALYKPKGFHDMSEDQIKKVIFEQIKVLEPELKIELANKYEKLQKLMASKENPDEARMKNVNDLLEKLYVGIEEDKKAPQEPVPEPTPVQKQLQNSGC